ncbi:MAG: PQQ-dependent sugar dehydrogenase [Bacteroidia bacterium]
MKKYNTLNQSSFCKTIIGSIIFLFVFNTILFSQTLPAGFSKVKVATLDQATAMAFAPDGRLFICVKNGPVRIIKNGSLLSTPFVTLSVDINGERGVNSIAFDPNFNTNHYVYIYYTASSPTIHNRLSRFTANGDVVVPGSEVPLLDVETVTQVFHNGGGMAFGPDGKLYLAIGEDNHPNNSQNMNTYKGKLLRLNADGSAPTDNPYYNSSSQVTKKIWALGLRNPYTLSFQPGTGKLFVNDVGADDYEDIHDATLPGKNFGWPAVEGSSTNPAYSNPVFSYPHESTGQKGCAIVGGTFFNPTTTNYPSQYIGKYFYMDFCNGWMYYLSLGSPIQNTFFGSGLVTQNLGLQVGPDGNLYFINRSQPGIYKIIYNNTNAPGISSHPSNLTVTAGQPASFSVSATGTNPLGFQWQKNGVNIPGATSSTYTISNTQSSHAGQYRAVVTNSYGTATSNAATLTVTAFNAAPNATILSPANQTPFRAGDIINFSGDATDAEDGTLPASAFEWTVEFHHNNNHFHPGPVIPSGIKTGSFATSNDDHTSANIFYRLKLRVTDSHGLVDTAYVDIVPITSSVTIVTQPPGLQITFDSQPKPTPFSTLTVEGLHISMGVVTPQTVNGQSYAFSHWLQRGGGASQTILIGEGDSTYTAVFKDTVIQSAELITSGSQWKYLANGSNQGTAWRSTTFNDAAWNTGTAQLGYGDGDEATVVSYGSSASNKYITTYFRKSFNVADINTVSGLELSLMRDDGAVVYLNGTEVYRNNMPSGTISYNTLATTYVDGTAESAYLVTNISKTALVNGNNVIAVEIHQNAATSSDISFDLKLRTVTPSTNSCSATGSITRDFWANVTGGTISSVPVNSNPTSTTTLSSFEGPSQAGENYGSRIRGYICPPTSGTYTFWIASDNSSELWLSTTDQPANKVKIASVSGYTSSRQWTKYTTQKSSPISLMAGVKYYIEAIHVEGTQGDNLAVGWQLPDGTMERPIPGTRLSPFAGSGNSSSPIVSIASPANNTVYSSSANITITADASISGGTIAKVEFYQGTTKIGEDITAPYAYTWMNVPTGNYALKAVATSNTGLTGTSQIVNISVNTCSTPIITPSGPTTICSGTVVLNSSTGQDFVYQWKKDGANITNATGPSYTATVSGEYQVKVIRGSCISWSAPILVKIENGLRASITPGGPTSFCQGGNVKLYANTCSGYTYQWKKDGSDIPGANGSTYIASVSGSYQLRVSQNGANAWSALVFVTVQQCHTPDDAGNEDTFADNELKSYTPETPSTGPFQMKVYPNPTTGLFSIVLNMATTDQEKIRMRMVNMLGQEVYTKETVANSNYLKETVELDGTLPPGLYTLQIIIGGQVESTSVVLSKQ